MDIKILDSNDFLSFKRIRLFALKNDPMAFGSSYAEESQKTDSYFKNKIKQERNKFTIGFFESDHLVNIASFTQQNNLKEQHKGEITSVYCLNNYRNQGLTKKILTILLDKAFLIPELKILKIAVLSENEPAKKLYSSLGFKKYGREPYSLFDGEKYYDEDLMYIDYEAFIAQRNLISSIK
ncbi:GNAT family N-acetyltransferase [Liquorilactobacillus hordei]|uniref:GNAT family N-acetyltransferase n=1 Tax=Liquorilactobacillus hordei TaxID=468911 RepID=UPI0039EC14FE